MATPIQQVKEFRQAHINSMILRVLQGVMTGIVYSLEAKDEYSRQHSGRVAEMSRRFSRILGNDSVRTLQIYLAASAHDVGKIGIPDAVLLCTERLSDEQWEIMKTHPQVGAEILTKTVDSLRESINEDGFAMPLPPMVVEQIEEVRNGILHHHERWDGKGYPAGLKGEEIPYISRLIALCDSTDAMMSKRVYRNALSAETCLEELKKNTGVMYDPELAEKFIENFGEITDGVFTPECPDDK